MMSTGKIEDVSIEGMCRLFHIDPETIDSFSLAYDGVDTIIEFYNTDNNIVAKFVNGDYVK